MFQNAALIGVFPVLVITAIVVMMAWAIVTGSVADFYLRVSSLGAFAALIAGVRFLDQGGGETKIAGAILGASGLFVLAFIGLGMKKTNQSNSADDS